MMLRAAMALREGAAEAERQIGRGLRAWAIERRGALQPRGRATEMVFGRSRSDAIRRAAAPARLGEEMCDDVTEARPVLSGWDEPVVWPFDTNETED